MYVCVYACMLVCVHACMCACMYACMCVRVRFGCRAEAEEAGVQYMYKPYSSAVYFPMDRGCSLGN